MTIGAMLRARIQPKTILASGLFLLVMGPFVILGEALVRAHLPDRDAHIPTEYFARPFVVTPYLDITSTHLQNRLEALGYRRVRHQDVGPGEYYRGRRDWVVGRRAFRHGARLQPAFRAVLLAGYDGTISGIRSEDGSYLSQLMFEPQRLPDPAGTDPAARQPVPIEQMPDFLIDAVLTIEDQHFFEHDGFDLKRIAGAAWANLRARRVVQGASTITQQLAKNLFLSPRRTPIRKLRELAMAMMLERRYEKVRILEAYLNEIYLGQDGGHAVHGVGSAAQYYFAKDVSELSLGEAALLAGLIRGPSLYSPIRHPERAQERRNLVLDLMRRRGIITDSEAEHAAERALTLASKRGEVRTGRYFVDYVAGHLAATLDTEPEGHGLAVFTTLDLELQRHAERAVREGLARLERSTPSLQNASAPLQAALVAIDPSTGEILAMVGGRDYGTSQFNRAVYARRQPGSAFKPFVALAALSRKGGYTLASVLDDEPLSVETPAGVWQPANYDGRFRGEVTIREALERSLNVPFARLGLEVGPDNIVETAHNLGIEGPLTPVPSLALGSSEVTPLEMARAFGVFAAYGFRADLQATLGVLDAEGKLMDRIEVKGEQPYTPEETFLITSALAGAVDHGTGRGVRQGGYRGAVAAKSGTTNDFRDAWFVGYTPQLAVGVWVGFDDGRPVGISGARAAQPIFTTFLIDALGRNGDGRFHQPWGIVEARVGNDSYGRSRWSCSGPVEIFIRGTTPPSSCSAYGYQSTYRYQLPRRYPSSQTPRRDTRTPSQRRGTR